MKFHFIALKINLFINFNSYGWIISVKIEK